jgi:quercetin dioxygenase-like cupin family protein
MIFHLAGDVVETHGHTFDHCTLLAAGRLKVEHGGEVEIIDRPGFVWIAKGVEHRLTALDPGTVAVCLHALRHEDGRAVLREEAAGLSAYEILELTRRL